MRSKSCEVKARTVTQKPSGLNLWKSLSLTVELLGYTQIQSNPTLRTPTYNKDTSLQWNLDIMNLYIPNDFLYRCNSKYITKPWCREQILPIPWPFIISRFHCVTDSFPGERKPLHFFFLNSTRLIHTLSMVHSVSYWQALIVLKASLKVRCLVNSKNGHKGGQV